MFEIISVFLLGILQGVTEFLPVSSSGHLVILERVTGRTPDLALNVGLHAGSLAAILWFYRREWVSMLRSLAPGQKTPQTAEERRFFGCLALATLVTAPVALALRNPVEGLFSEPAAGRFLAVTFSMTAAFLVLERFTASDRPRLSWKGALVVGLVQGLAVFPGISRSGSTIAAARMMGVPRETAARFSFLLAVPVIGGAFLLEAPDLFRQMDIVPLAIGMAAAAAAGLLSLVLLEKLLKAQRFSLFALYLVPLALLVGFFLP